MIKSRALCCLSTILFVVIADASSCLKILGGEWGDIDHVVIGNPRGARMPHEVPQMLSAVLPSGPTLKEILQNPGAPFDPSVVAKAEMEVEGLINKLNFLGIKTSQPQFGEDFFSQPILTPDFRSNAGLYAAMPRDNLLLLPPNLIVLAPMSWRSRHNEHKAYAEVVKELEQMGLTVVEAPRPRLTDDTYVKDWKELSNGHFRSVIHNNEVLFDAADFIRFGNHIVGQLSHVTNRKGVEWIRSVLDPKYHLHVIEFNDEHPMHIDATIMPLSLGKVLVHPQRVPAQLRAVLQDTLFRDWEMIEAPYPENTQRETPLYFTSDWINMNMLVGPGWAIVEEKDKAVATVLKANGIEAVPQAFQNFQCLGGSFHCASLDIRWREENESVLDAREDTYVYFDHNRGGYFHRPLWQ